jgi:hypothetical protein
MAIESLVAIVTKDLTVAQAALRVLPTANVRFARADSSVCSCLWPLRVSS